jgi:ABC-2 type transport system permease protein
MMRRFHASVVKEILLLLRDKAGITMLFIMPVALVFIMVVIQDAAINALNDNKVPLLLVDNDHDTLSENIRKGMINTGILSIVDTVDGEIPSPEKARQLVASGKYQVGVIIPAGASDTLRSNAKAVVKKSFYNIGMIRELPSDTLYDSVRIDVFFDPSLRAAIKTGIAATVSEFSIRTESHEVYKMYSEVLNMMLPEGQEFKTDYPEVITYKTQYATEPDSTIKPNAVQHNIPSWTLFAMFFIVIPLGASLIKEKEEGTYLRLITMPGSYSTIFTGKLIVYLMVAIIQFFLMMLVGFYLIPLMGMPQLVIGKDLLALATLVISSAFSAIGFGLMIGSISTTQQQASSFGSIIIIILASIGGLFMPTYLMPKSARFISDYSPLSWAHQSFQDLFVRDGDLAMIWPNLWKILVFGASCFLIAILYNRLKKIR